MNLEITEDTIRVSDIVELTAVNAELVVVQVCAAIPETMKVIEIDLAKTHFIDGAGFNALSKILNTVRSHSREAVVWLRNSNDNIFSLLQLLGYNKIFQIA